MVDKTAIVHGGTGVVGEGAGVTIRVSDSTISGNAVGRTSSAGATLLLFPSTVVEANGDDDLTPLIGRTGR
jgi:hypothetical protein